MSVAREGQMMENTEETESIEDLKQKANSLREELRASLVRLQKAQRAVYHIKAGDLLEVKDGTYGNPILNVYRVGRIVFAGDDVNVYGFKLLKDGQTFDHREKRLYLWTVLPKSAALEVSTQPAASAPNAAP
jgi:hypothetical protein